MEQAVLKPYDPLERAAKIEPRIIDAQGRRPFRSIEVESFYGQMATARSVGCNLGCGFCWVDPSRDCDDGLPQTRHPLQWLTPEQAYEELIKTSRDGMMTEMVRISGCEPTIGWPYMMDFIRTANNHRKPKPVLLETNGILLGANPEMASDLEPFRESVLVRLSLKAGLPEAFERKTGAAKEFFDLPLQALEHLVRSRINFRLAAMFSDTFFTSPEERRNLLSEILSRVNPQEPAQFVYYFEDEEITFFGRTRERLSRAGFLPDSLPRDRRIIYEPYITSLTYALAKQMGFTAEDMKDMRKIAEVSDVLYGMDTATVLSLLPVTEFQTREVPLNPRDVPRTFDDSGVIY